MRGLTLTQPWATLVALGEKHWETRSWDTPYRGSVVITAAKKYPLDDRMLCLEEPFRSALARHGYNHPDKLPTGVVVAHCILKDAVYCTGSNYPGEPERSFGNFEEDRFAFRLDVVRNLYDGFDEPLRIKGALGLFNLSAEAEGLVRARMHLVDVGRLERAARKAA